MICLSVDSWIFCSPLSPAGGEREMAENGQDINKAIDQMLMPCALAEWQEEYLQTLHMLTLILLWLMSFQLLMNIHVKDSMFYVVLHFI